LVERCVKKKALVVYPQVNARRFKDASLKRKRENIVVTYSQYAPTQNLGYVPRIAGNAKMANFIIIGPSGTASKSTFKELHRIMAELSIEDRVKLLTNQPFSKYVELLSTAKVFLRTLQHEPFGMSVVEAMAAGCVPVVPRDGGPWFDILEGKEGVYGFSYASIGEAAQKIRVLLQNEELRAKVSARASRRAMDFDNSVFESRISSIVKKVYLSKLSCTRLDKPTLA
jgi:glycosyltransferase involved in cell wall biosynthesis